MPSVGEKRRQQERARKLRAQESENEIYPIPPIFDLRRRVECERDPERWLKTYLPGVFFSDFSESQKRFIRECWEAIESNNSKNIEAYRGFGKTSILSGLLLMCLLTGRIRHAIYLVAEGGRMTKQASGFFNTALYEDYDRPIEEARAIVADYPEVCYPLQRRRGVANKPLRYRGEPVDIVVSPDRLQLPTIPGSPSSGSLLTFASIRSPVRGASHQIRGVGSFRVGAVLFDDVQTDANATSEKEIESIVSTIKSAVGFLSGKTKEGRKEPLIILSAITQNRPGDVAEKIRNDVPELNTVTIPFLRSTPTDFSAWKNYKEKRRDVYLKHADKPERARKKINDYYLANRDDLERDCVADDERIYEPDQLSAVQYALEKWCVSERSFWCELQNDATRAAQEDGGGLAPVTVFRKRREIVGKPGELLRRLQVPKWADVMTGFVDVGEHYLNYSVIAFQRDAKRSHVVDFGIWPPQKVSATTKHNYTVDIQEYYKLGDKFERVKYAIVDCLEHIAKQTYINEKGGAVDVHRSTEFIQNARVDNARRVFRFLSAIGVDAGDGETAPAVWDAVAQFHRVDEGLFFGRAIPTYGTTARGRLIRYYPLKLGEYRRGGRGAASICDWIENPSSRRPELDKYKGIVPAALLFDANSYKTRRLEAWLTPLDRDGATSIFDDPDAELIGMYAEHQAAEEVARERTLDGQLYKVWQMKKPRVSDNEFLDTDTGARALAHYVGVEPDIGKAKRKKIKWI